MFPRRVTRALEATVLKLRAYVPAMFWAGFLLYLGGRSDVPAVATSLPLDKAAHFVLYGVLGALGALGYRRAGRWPPLVWLVLLALLTGLLDELHQATVPGRSADALDWCADALGFIAGCTAVLKLVKERTPHGA